ncbi:IclR family transcriptional regulator [Microbaculum marinisediminis]|uniref:IclR family transcriptional regulator n=1 Tax=Microbaculum marinisediminis TaxID=2931392 RepID=A0AAW5R5I4_9HYPH|nr:IclR family transcriptional regulator [Microbaculum sp. A6E488]MCT8973933.1 IclR family transcriptional regulator [Microbaculum sp. A6E488]
MPTNERSKNGSTDKPGVPIVRSVERAVALLRVFSADEMHLSLTELSRRTGLDKSTTRRLLHTLSTLDLIEADERRQTYALGTGVLTLMPAVSYGENLRDVAAQALARLTEKTSATSFLWGYYRGMALCLERVKTLDKEIDVRSAVIGTQISMNCAGGPRVVLANLSEAQRAAAVSGPLPKYTPFTEIDPAALEAAATEIRARGWELAVDDYIVGLSGLGAPVFDRGGNFIASVSITTLTPRLAPRKNGQPEQLPALLEAAAEIGAQIQP